MDHVNNAVYADWLDEAVQGAGGTVAVRAVPRLARLEYARAAAPGAIRRRSGVAGRRCLVVPDRGRRRRPAPRPARAARDDGAAAVP